MSEPNISYPFVVTGYKFGTMWYPKRLGKISVYLADIARATKGNIPLIVKELNQTILEELCHLYARTPNYHENFDKNLEEVCLI